ncbi:MAG: KamA family protein [Candidatus Marinimicrobia bacterium]|nr:KamA family protein [Candidatus Neomarinimicrobiota bacterium]
MTELKFREKIALSAKSLKLINQIILENPFLESLLIVSQNYENFKQSLRAYILDKQKYNPNIPPFFQQEHYEHKNFEDLKWQEVAAVRILDYIDHAGETYVDLNFDGRKIISDPFLELWTGFHKKRGEANADFFMDMLMLFRQYNGTLIREIPAKEQVCSWMERYPTGLDREIRDEHIRNKRRIIHIFIKKFDSGVFQSEKYKFEEGMSQEEKYWKVREWWNDYAFHLKFAVRDPDLLNQLLDYSLSEETMEILYNARQKGIPFFVNPYYLTLLLVDTPFSAAGADNVIRDYIIYSRQLVEEYGHITAWEKEDVVEPGKPNAAGWLLPTKHNIHRRYPEVAILIPDTVGRACGGLCASCQRMYDFQSGHLNFDLKKLEPKSSWNQKLEILMEYFERDSQLRDILITGGDALMSAPKNLDQILDAIYEMAKRKIEANKKRKEGEKYAELLRVRLGTRLLAYLPYKINDEMCGVLAKFKQKASKIGVKQFVIQTHFQSPLEITPISERAINKIFAAGWIITNQLVFTTAASRRGHTAKLRKTLNDVGILTYYTFTCKGYMENQHSFATNARAIQESLEEKVIGKITDRHNDIIETMAQDAENILENINNLRSEDNLPFLATDTNVLNIPAVGKSLNFKVVGITKDGRRILEFDHDSNRHHSPIIEKMGKLIIIESKSIHHYLNQIEDMGEDPAEYESIYGYSVGAAEPRAAVYKYPDYDFTITDEMTNLEI